MKIYFAAALICTVSLLATGCRRPLDDISAPLTRLTLEVRLAPMMPALTAVDVKGAAVFRTPPTVDGCWNWPDRSNCLVRQREEWVYWHTG